MHVAVFLSLRFRFDLLYCRNRIDLLQTNPPHFSKILTLRIVAKIVRVYCFQICTCTIFWLFQVLTNEDEAEKQVVQSLSLATQDYPVTVVAPAPTCMPVAKGQESDGIYFARPVDLNGSASTPSG